MATANHSRPPFDPVTPHVGPVRPETAPASIPPLENGDRLTRAEFHRRYEAMPGVKAELIEGVVYMASPVRMRQHGRPSRIISTWLGTYQADSPGIDGADNVTIRLDEGNESQPDHVLFLPRSLGGQSQIDDRDYLTGGPELVIEIAASTESYDLHDKLNVYRRNKVREYMVWRTRDAAVDWFAWREGDYVRLTPDASGVYRSEVFPGLWLDTAALLRGDAAGLLGTLRLGLASPEHQAFVARLQQQA